MKAAGPVIVLVLVSVAVAGAAPAGAATIRVDTTLDRNDAAADGDCASQNGRCTLRAALQEARGGFFPGLDRIKLPAGTYRLRDVESSVVDTPDLDVQEQVTILGRGMTRTTIEQTVPGAGVFEVYAGAGVTTFRKLTIRGGRAVSGAGIASHQSLVVDRVTVTDNRASNPASSAVGGGIFSADSLLVTDSNVSDNRIRSTASGGSASGGGIYHEADDASETIEVRRSVISGNRATYAGGATTAFGGGVRTTGPALIDRTTIKGNHSDGGGGGIIHTGSGAGSQLLTLSRSTVSGNEARSGGGMIVFEPVAVENSTISGNTVTGEFANGGGIYRGGGTTIGLEHVTVARNQAPPGQASGLLSDPSSGTIAFGASIIANPGIDCAGLTTSLGYSVAEGGDCPLSASGDYFDGEADLRPLDDNGGPTRTQAIRPTSDARNAVTSGCPAPATDQRGVERPQGPACDAGAFELE